MDAPVARDESAPDVVITVTEPTPQVQQMYLDLIQTALDNYTGWLAQEGYLLKRCARSATLRRGMVHTFMGEIRG